MRTMAVALILSLTACTTRQPEAASKPDPPDPERPELAATPADKAPEPADQAEPSQPTANPPAEPGACPDGRLVQPLWVGEYPNPVVQVDRPFTVAVADAPCAAPSRACTVPAGLYHPWAEGLPEAVQFASRVRPVTFVAGAAIAWPDRTLPAGTEVVVLSYLAEGHCKLRLDGEELDAMCPGVADEGPWEKRTTAGPGDDQLVRVPCDGGEPGWLRVDDTLMERPEVRSGQITAYGEAKRAE